MCCSWCWWCIFRHSEECFLTMYEGKMRTLLCFPQGHCGSSSRLGSYSRNSPKSFPDTGTNTTTKVEADVSKVNTGEKNNRVWVIRHIHNGWVDYLLDWPVSTLLWLLLARPKLRLLWLALRDAEKDEVESMVFLRPPRALVGYRNWV